jgi:hypothetical protein
MSACAIDAEPDDLDEAEPEPELEASVPEEPEEPSAEPGCTTPPTHWCEPFEVYAEYPDPGPYGTEPGYLGCLNRADADLLTGCQMHGGIGLGCCGGNQPTVGNHDHPYVEWYGAAWRCTGRMKLRQPCHPGSGIPECQPVCD